MAEEYFGSPGLKLIYTVLCFVNSMGHVYVLKELVVECRLILLMDMDLIDVQINTLDMHLDWHTRLILDWHLINSWAAEWRPTHMHWSKITCSWLLTDCWLRFSVLKSSVNHAFSNKYSVHYYNLLLWNLIVLKIKIATDHYLFLFQISCCTLSLSRHCHKKAWNGHWSGCKNWGYSNSAFFVLDIFLIT